MAEATEIQGLGWCEVETTRKERALRVAYSVSLVVHAVDLTFIGASLWYPEWFSSRVWEGPHYVYSSYGLDQKCVAGVCQRFPSDSECHQQEAFCGVWKSASFSVWTGLIFQMAGLLTLVCACFGDRFTFLGGWKVIAVLQAVCVSSLIFATLTMDVILETSSRFRQGHWSLGRSWTFATVGWVLSLFIIMSLTIVGLMTSGDNSGELYCSDLDSVTTIASGEERDDFYYYNRRTRRNYLACN